MIPENSIDHLEGSCSIQLSYGRTGNQEFRRKKEECGAKSAMNGFDDHGDGK